MTRLISQRSRLFPCLSVILLGLIAFPQGQSLAQDETAAAVSESAAPEGALEPEVRSTPRLSTAGSESLMPPASEPEESLTSSGLEPIPVEPSTPVPKSIGRERSRRSRLTKDETELKADKRRVLITAGEDKVVDLDFSVEESRYISIGNPTVVSTSLITIDGKKRQMIFKPLKAGETTVSIRDPDGNIRIIFEVIVTPSNLVRRAEEIRLLLKDIEGVDIKVVGPNVVIDGELIVPGDYARMATVVQGKPYSDVVLMLATLSPLALQMLAKRVQEDISTFAPNVKTRVVNGMLFLEGAVDDPFHAKRAYELAKLYLPEVAPANPLASTNVPVRAIPARSLIQNFIIVNPAPPKKLDKLVKVTVHFVELRKDYNKAFGFNWAPGFKTEPQITVDPQGGGTNGGGASFTATISSLIPRLKSMQQAGFGRVVKEATVIVRSGIEGSLTESVQTLTPTFVAQGQPGQPMRAEVGFNLKVTPTILGQSDDLQVFMTLDQTAGVPSAASRRQVQTTLYVKSNESAAVGGFQGTSVNTDYNKDPLGNGTFESGQPFFQLKRTKDYKKDKTQFVVFLTPQIIESASEASETLKKNFRVKVK